MHGIARKKRGGWVPSYSSTSKARLDQCHADLQLLFTTVLERTDHSILCGRRGQQAQDKAYRTGKSQLQYPNSLHNQAPSMAVDAAPYFVEISNIDWSDIKAMCIFIGRVLETADRLYQQGDMTHRVRSGGDWDMDGRTSDQRFNDLAHFELVGL